MKKYLSAFVAALAAQLILLAPPALGEPVRIPIASQGGAAQSADRPSAGMTGDRVLARYGEPVRTLAPVGNPPITRWEYPDFYVYFEYNHVVHAVLKHRPARSGS